MGLQPPSSGIMAMRIGLEFGSREEFVASLEKALAKGGDRGATLVAMLDRGDLAVHIPRADGPCWNSVPLVHLQRREAPTPQQWAEANAVLEKLERYR